MNPFLFVVLHYGSVEDTIACVASLRGQDGADVLVVDNGSAASAAAAIRAAHPGIELLSLPENRGWAGGNNAGIRLGLDYGYQALCLLNNDTLVPQGAARRLLTILDQVGPAIVQPAIRYADPAEGMQRDPTAGLPASAAYVGCSLGDGLYTTNEAYGACLVVHRAVFERIGLIDERFFLQLEETDFALRAAKAGFGLFCDAKTVITHRESAAYGARTAPLKTYYTTRNTLLVAEKHERGPLPALRRLYWSLSHIAGRDGLGFVQWLVSRNRYARAARLGALHYALRRFGQASVSVRTKLAL